ncbi:MAG: SpoIIE family protein phosphatase [Chitinivibrionales bacterium]
MSYVDVEYYQRFKDGERVGGDSFLSKKIKEENRVISVLSDGLGSGVKANVLSTLTATMALNYVTKDMDIEKAARVIMRTLPVCKIRKISYSTFTIVDVEEDNNVRIIEYDNPSFILLRGREVVDIEKASILLDTDKSKEDVLRRVEFKAETGDRIVVFSDGVSQSGMGLPDFPLGWEEKDIKDFVSGIVKDNENISARELSRSIVRKAYSNNNNSAGDDITCGVINVREPRNLLVMTGPPLHPEKDTEMARIYSSFRGEKILCGGTTANIIGRELQKEIEVDMSALNKHVPPVSKMEGALLITEGTITLGRTAEILEKEMRLEDMELDGAVMLVKHLINHDRINFCVGTRINEAHQDPNVPVELEIRRNIIKGIIRVLENKYLKETNLQFI